MAGEDRAAHRHGRYELPREGATGLSIERLSVEDLSLLWLEECGWPQDIGLLAIVDSAGLVARDGHVEIEYLRRLISGRLHAVPRFRQRLMYPGPGRGRPYWADDAGFDIARHVHERRLPPEADEADLLEACEEIRRRGLDQTHPPWQWWVLHSNSPDRVAMLIIAHHTMFDGLAGLAALASLLQDHPDAESSGAPPWEPRPSPSARLLTRDARRGLRSGTAATLRQLWHPGLAFRRIVNAARGIRIVVGQEGISRTSLTHGISSGRHYALVRTDLDRIKRVARARRGTVHDVILAAVAGGDRALLTSRGEFRDDLCLRAVAPIARGPGDTGASSLLATLPIAEANPRKRLDIVIAETQIRKSDPMSYSQAGALSCSLIGKLAVRAAAHQRLATHYIGNVPGPRSPLFLGRARIRELFALAPLMGNMTIGIGALSYAGQLTLTVVADRDSSPDLDVFAAGMRDTLAALEGPPRDSEGE